MLDLINQLSEYMLGTPYGKVADGRKDIGYYQIEIKISEIPVGYQEELDVSPKTS